MFNEHFRNGKKNKCCQSINLNESYVDKMMMAKNEYKRKQNNKECCDVEKEMVIRYMTVLTQIFVIMDDILLFYYFSDKDGPRIQRWISNKSPRYPLLCTLKKLKFKMKW